MDHACVWTDACVCAMGAAGATTAAPVVSVSATAAIAVAMRTRISWTRRASVLLTVAASP